MLYLDLNCVDFINVDDAIKTMMVSSLLFLLLLPLLDTELFASNIESFLGQLCEKPDDIMVIFFPFQFSVYIT